MSCKKCKYKVCSCIVNEQVKIAVNKTVQNPDEKGVVNIKVPTKTSELINDSGFGQGSSSEARIENIRVNENLAPIVNKVAQIKVPTKTSDITNDSNFVSKSYIDSHIIDKNNPHNVTKEQLNLGNVDNTSDLNKPISTATQNALNTKLSFSEVKDEVVYQDLKPVNSVAIERYSIKKVNTIVELRNTKGEYEGQIIQLLGYYDKGDKESLNYKWTLTQGVDDSGSVINSENGSWLAVFGDNIKVEDFGAKGDVASNGTGTDDTSSFLTALNYINSKKGGVLKLSNKKYLVTDTLPLYNYTYITGSNGGAQEYLGVLNNPTTIVYKGVNTLFKNLSIDDGDYHSTIFFGGLQKLNILTYTDVILYDLSSIQFSNNTDVTISGINRVGHAISGYSDGSFNNFVNCCFEKLNIGLKPKLKIGYPFDDNSFVNCRWHDNNIGVELNYESDSNKFIGCSFAYNNIDITLDNARNNYFQNIRIENRINKSVRLLNGARNNSLFMTAMINLSTVTSDFKLFIDEGVDNIVHLLPDSTHYSLHSDFYPENSNSGYTSSVPCNLVSDCYSINDKSIEIGSLVSESYEPGYFKKDRIKRIINTNTLTYYKINIDKKVLKTLNPNDELVAGIWIKTDNSNYSDLNQLLRVVQLLNDNSDVEIVSHYVHPNDNDWHLCKVSFRINSNYNKNSTVALYLRLFLQPNVNILISKPMLYHGNTLYNNMMNDYKNNGESIKRPNLTTDDKGIVFFDVDINKPIWWNGTTWVDSSGASV